MHRAVLLLACACTVSSSGDVHQPFPPYVDPGLRSSLDTPLDPSQIQTNPVGLDIHDPNFHRISVYNQKKLWPGTIPDINNEAPIAKNYNDRDHGKDLNGLYPHGKDAYGQHSNGPFRYGQSPYGQSPYDQYPYGQQNYGKHPYGPHPYGNDPTAPVSYPQNPFIKDPFDSNSYPLNINTKDSFHSKGLYPKNPYTIEPLANDLYGYNNNNGQEPYPPNSNSNSNMQNRLIPVNNDPSNLFSKDIFPYIYNSNPKNVYGNDPYGTGIYYPGHVNSKFPLPPPKDIDANIFTTKDLDPSVSDLDLMDPDVKDFDVKDPDMKEYITTDSSMTDGHTYEPYMPDTYPQNQPFPIVYDEPIYLQNPPIPWTPPEYVKNLQDVEESIARQRWHFTPEAIKDKDDKGFRYIILIHVVTNLAEDVAANGWGNYNSSYAFLVKNIIDMGLSEPHQAVSLINCEWLDPVQRHIKRIKQIIEQPAMQYVCGAQPSSCDAVVWATVQLNHTPELLESATALRLAAEAAKTFLSYYAGAFEAISSQNVYKYLFLGEDELRALVAKYAALNKYLLDRGDGHCLLK